MLAKSLPMLLVLVVAGSISASAAPSELETKQALLDFGVQLPHEQRPAPDFVLRRLDGGSASLQQQSGRLTLVHFWATWCVPCRHEMPLLYRLGQQFSAQGLSIASVNVDRGDAGGVAEFLSEVSPGFHTLLDPDGEVRKKYEIRALPTTYFVGEDGLILGRVFGERDWQGEKAIALMRHLLSPQ
ncbi:MAG: TlpA disulfide reductase family protein [Mariprofundaceae bacterium]|nr:TlpA disulfide reductase family protein [Mariprofundaceae bacterium]